MQRKPSRDELFVNEALRLDIEEALAPPETRRPEVTAMQVLAFDGAVERLLERANETLAKDSSDRRALRDWVGYFRLYLDMQLPKAEHLYKEPLGLLVSVLDQVDRGSLHPVLKNAVHSRPTDSTAKQDFKIRCVLAAGLTLKARLGLNRQEADQRIQGDKRVKRAAAKFGISFKERTIRDWRRDIKRAYPGETLEIGYRTLSGFAELRMRNAGLDAAVGFLLDRIADPEHVA
jgi:hypothetical protein